ncbi:hypothetical protein GALMADRAFT_144776 [Galerina marginata CBS 339.88]|uniref:Uncharacterized protein n=1 Tax=Galerina marginata (strain CBS 339.88) TaxID=685588 RepID=A0A067SUS6_GALM3|nr:hypothetical protein GALMADRAFT_144776 [Galerina marginata CBS 339.88]
MSLSALDVCGGFIIDDRRLRRRYPYGCINDMRTISHNAHERLSSVIRSTSPRFSVLPIVRNQQIVNEPNPLSPSSLSAPKSFRSRTWRVYRLRNEFSVDSNIYHSFATRSSMSHTKADVVTANTRSVKLDTSASHALSLLTAIHKTVIPLFLEANELDDIHRASADENAVYQSGGTS